MKTFILCLAVVAMFGCATESAPTPDHAEFLDPAALARYEQGICGAGCDQYLGDANAHAACMVDECGAPGGGGGVGGGGGGGYADCYEGSPVCEQPSCEQNSCGGLTGYVAWTCYRVTICNSGLTWTEWDTYRRYDANACPPTSC